MYVFEIFGFWSWNIGSYGDRSVSVRNVEVFIGEKKKNPENMLLELFMHLGVGLNSCCLYAHVRMRQL